MTEQQLAPGLVFRACDPRDLIRIRIVHYLPGWQRASIVDATTGKRHRQILAASLHMSALTATGVRRRTGYCLDTPANREVLAAPEGTTR